MSPVKKLNCILDDIRSLLNTIRVDDYLSKLDDTSGNFTQSCHTFYLYVNLGFNHLVLSPHSKRLSYMRFGNYLIHPHALPFGLPASPSKFQLSNRLGTRLVSQYNERCYLYLDDRCVASEPLIGCEPHEHNATRGIVYSALYKHVVIVI